MDKIYINPLFYIAVAASIIMIPLPISIAWFTAALIHEVFHILALRLCRCHILSIEIGIMGAKITTEYLNNAQEFLCAMAGPLAGFCLLVFAKYFPLLCLCGFIQSMFNLIPLMPYDGGRILKCILVKVMGYKKTEKLYPVVHRCLCFIFCGLVFSFALKSQAYLVLFALLPICRSKNLLAKRQVTRYNR